MSKALLLNKMTWPEVEAIKDKVEVVVIPAGSTEQHGPNTSFATDTVRAEKLAELIGNIYGEKMLIGPALPIGLSYHHMKCAGTITFSIETYLKVLKDICWSLKQHGFNKVLFLVGHGGNKKAISEFMTVARMELDMEVYWAGTGGSWTRDLTESKGYSKIRGHACEIETSQTMYLAPDHVRYENLTKGELNPNSKYTKKATMLDAGSFWDYSEISHNGALGDATQATAAYGKEMTDLIIKRMCNYINQIVL